MKPKQLEKVKELFGEVGKGGKLCAILSKLDDNTAEEFVDTLAKLAELDRSNLSLVINTLLKHGGCSELDNK